MALDAPSFFHAIRASVVAEMARRKFLSGENEDPLTAVPLYVRASEAEIRNPNLAIPLAVAKDHAGRSPQ
jgi:hypothetical protein